MGCAVRIRAQQLGAGEEGIDHSGAIEDFELSVGNDGSDWGSDIEDEMSSLDNVLSIISGDETEEYDWLWFGRTDDSGNGGSFKVTPYGANNAPTLRLSVNLDPEDDGDSDQFMEMDLGVGLITNQNSDNQAINLDTSGDPIIKVLDAADDESQSHSFLDNNSLTCYDVDETCTITADAGAESISIDDGGGGSVVADVSDEPQLVVTDAGGSTGTYQFDNLVLNADDGGEVDLDAGDIGGGTAQMRQVSWYGPGGLLNTAYLLATDPEMDDGADFKTAVQTIIAEMSWTATCNDDGTITITAEGGS